MLSLERVLMLILVALLGAVAVLLLSDRGSHAGPTPIRASEFDGPRMPPGLRAAGFQLSDPSGHRVSMAATRGHVVVLTFIHSRCHDTCPFMVEQIKGALNELPDSGRGVPAIGISVAPREDTPASRRRFLARHQMTGRLEFLNGPLPLMRRVWHAYAMAPATPHLDHTTFVFLVDKRGYERVGFAADQLTPEGLAHDIRVLEREPA